MLGHEGTLNVLGWEVTLYDTSFMAAAFVGIVLLGLLLYAFLQTNLGSAMRATGDNDQMIRALGVNHEHDRSWIGRFERADRIGGRIPRTVSGLRRRSNGDRHGSVGPGKRNHR